MIKVHTNNFAIVCTSHKFAPIAEEMNQDGGLIWQWCIKCGRLKLGNEIFTYGSHQKNTIVAD